MRAIINRFKTSHRGNVTVITALFSLILAPLCALAVDGGSMYLDSRKLQGVADLAALAAADDLTRAQAAAEATVRANGYKDVHVHVSTGHYDSSRKGHPSNRFVKGGMDAGGSHNGVHVTLTGKSKLYFGELLLGRKHVDIKRKATATRSEMVAFSIASRAASLNGGVLNGLLGGLTGSDINLSVMDYEKLIDADLDLLGYVKALHTRANIEGASFNDILDTEITVGDALRVLALQADSEECREAAATLRLLAGTSINTTKIKLSQLLDLGVYGEQDHYTSGSSAAVRVDSLSLVRAMLELANANRQVELKLGGNALGLANLKVWLAIGERANQSPWLSITRDGSRIVRTAQMRLYIEAEKSGGLGNVLGLLGVQALDVPILVELASGEAKLDRMHCTRPSSACNVTLAVRPSIGQVTVGKISPHDLRDFKRPLNPQPATLLGLPLVKATASAQIKLGGVNWQKETFTAAEIAKGTVKTVKTNDAVQGIASSLLGNTKINVDVLNILGILGLGLNAGLIENTLGGLLTTVAAPVDGVLNALLGVLGVGLGEVDVRVNNLRCTGSSLVG